MKPDTLSLNQCFEQTSVGLAQNGRACKGDVSLSVAAAEVQVGIGSSLDLTIHVHLSNQLKPCQFSLASVDYFRTLKKNNHQVA